MIEDIEKYVLENYEYPDFPQTYESFIKANYKDPIKDDEILGDEKLTGITNAIINGEDVDESYLGTFKDYMGETVCEPENDFIKSLALEARYIDDAEYLEWLNDDKMAKVLAEFPTRGDLIDHLGPTIEEIKEKYHDDPNLDLLLKNMTYKSHPLAFYEFSANNEIGEEGKDFATTLNGDRYRAEQAIKKLANMFKKENEIKPSDSSLTDKDLKNLHTHPGRLNNDKLLEIAEYGLNDHDRELAKAHFEGRSSLLVNEAAGTSIPMAIASKTITGELPNKISKGVLNVTNFYSPGVITAKARLASGPTHTPGIHLQGQVRDMAEDKNVLQKVMKNIESKGLETIDTTKNRNMSKKSNLGPATNNPKVNDNVQSRISSRPNDANFAERNDPTNIDSYEALLAKELDNTRKTYSGQLKKMNRFKDRINDITDLIETGNVNEYIKRAKKAGVLDKLDDLKEFEDSEELEKLKKNYGNSSMEMSKKKEPWEYEYGDWIPNRKIRRAFDKEDKKRFQEYYTNSIRDAMDKRYSMGKYDPNNQKSSSGNKIALLAAGAGTALVGKVLYDSLKKPAKPKTQVQKQLPQPQVNTEKVDNQDLEDLARLEYQKAKSLPSDHSIVNKISKLLSKDFMQNTQSIMNDLEKNKVDVEDPEDAKKIDQMVKSRTKNQDKIDNMEQESLDIHERAAQSQAEKTSAPKVQPEAEPEKLDQKKPDQVSEGGSQGKPQVEVGHPNEPEKLNQEKPTPPPTDGPGDGVSDDKEKIQKPTPSPESGSSDGASSGKEKDKQTPPPPEPTKSQSNKGQKPVGWRQEFRQNKKELKEQGVKLTHAQKQNLKERSRDAYQMDAMKKANKQFGFKNSGKASPRVTPGGSKSGKSEGGVLDKITNGASDIFNKADEVWKGSTIRKDLKTKAFFEGVGKAASGAGKILGKGVEAVGKFVNTAATGGNNYYRPPMNGYGYGYGYMSEDEDKKSDGANWE